MLGARRALGLLGLGLLFAACAAREAGPLGSPALMAHVRVLADPRLEGRAAGSDGEREAARYVTERLRAMGLEPLEQPVPSVEGSRNVYALVGGTGDEIVVIGAHLDHLGRLRGALYPGADDDASGVAVVLGVAESLARRRDRIGRTVAVVFFGAEEPGIFGSQYFVAHPPFALSRVVAMVNVDMVGRPLVDKRWAILPMHWMGIRRGRAVGLFGVRRYPGLRALADQAFAAEGEVVAAEDFPARIEREIEAQAADRGDSVPFERAGIPALFFGDGESRDYHRPTDSVDRLHPRLLGRTARLIERVVVALAGAPASAFASSDARPAKRRPVPGWYLPVGLTGAWSSDRDWIWGGEASLVHLWSASIAYAGVYGDLLRDGDSGTSRVSFGPELGWRWLGLDGGYLLELDGGEVVRRGAVGRLFATASLLSIGVRGGYARAEGGDADGFVEIDLQLKYPLRLF